jgi:hypothetical protein
VKLEGMMEVTRDDRPDDGMFVDDRQQVVLVGELTVGVTADIRNRGMAAS